VVQKKTETPAPAGPAASSAEGASIFKRSSCTVCHGADASGNTPMGKKNKIPDFHSAVVQSQSDAELSRLIAEGKGPVSAGAHKSKHLTPDQVKALVAYIRTLK
jgi:mono/diheme cytochrome c family protein